MLTGAHIVAWYKQGYIHISDFNPENVGPNSYDVRLSHILKTYQSGDDPHHQIILDCKTENATAIHEIPEDGMILMPGTLYLGSTMEEIGSDYFVPMYEGRSSLARLGIQSHISAGFGDIGFKSKWTLEIAVVHPVRIYPGMRIGQVYFHTVNTIAPLPRSEGIISYIGTIMSWINYKAISLYTGKYTEQDAPQESKLYQDFKN